MYNASMLEKVSIIIVNWNTGSRLAETLLSLKNLSPEEQHRISLVVVVDNASTDGSVAQAKHVGLVSAHFIDLSSNEGFARANNVGVEYAFERGSKDTHILLLNPDTVVPSGAITGMLSVLETDEKVGIVGPKLLEESGAIQPSVRRFPTIIVLKTFFLKLTRFVKWLPFWKKYTMSDMSYDKAQSVDQVMGAAFLIRNAVWKQIGKLDESFWIWFEEVDYCKRAQEHGWLVWYTPAATVTHFGGVSFDQRVGFSRTVPMMNSALVYAKKHLSIFSYLVLLLLYPIGLLLTIPASFAHLVFKRKNKERLAT